MCSEIVCSYLDQMVTLLKGRHIRRAFHFATFQNEGTVTARISQSCRFAPEIHIFIWKENLFGPRVNNAKT